MKYLLILIFLIVWSISDVFSLTGENIEEVESSICSNMYEIRLRVEEVTDTKYLRNFKAVWDLKLEAILSSMPVCDGKLVKNIRVYSTSIIYLWEDVPEIETGMKDVFEKNSVLFLNIPEKDILKDELREELSKNIASSDILIIGSSDLLATFTEIAKIQKSKAIENLYSFWLFTTVPLENTRIFALSNLSKKSIFNYERRILLTHYSAFLRNTNYW